MLHPSLRSIDAVTGATVAELRDEGLELSGFAFSPLPGRHADGDHPRADRRAASGDLGRVAPASSPTCRSSCPGRSSPSTGGPTARPCSCSSSSTGRHHLHRYDLATGAVTRSTPSRDPSRRRPSGPTARSGTASTTASTRRRCSRSGSTTPLLAPEGSTAPEGRPFEPWWFENPNGQRVHGFLVRPDGRRATSRDDAGARRAALDRHGPLGPGRPRPRRRRVPRRDGQLPRVGRVRTGVARRADGERGVPGGRGRPGRPRRPRRARARRSGRGSCWPAGRGAATSR